MASGNRLGFLHHCKCLGLGVAPLDGWLMQTTSGNKYIDYSQTFTIRSLVMLSRAHLNSLNCEFELRAETEKLVPVKGGRGLGNHTVDSNVRIVLAGLVEKVNQATRLGVDVRLEIAGVDLDGEQGPGRQPEQFTRTDALRVAIDRRPDVPIRDVKSVIDGGELEAALEDLRLVGARVLDGTECERIVRLGAHDEGTHYSTTKYGAGASTIL